MFSILIIIGFLIFIRVAFHYVNFFGVKVRSSPITIKHFTDEYDYDFYHSAVLFICNENKEMHVLVDKRNNQYYIKSHIIFYKIGRINGSIKIITP